MTIGSLSMMLIKSERSDASILRYLSQRQWYLSHTRGVYEAFLMNVFTSAIYFLVLRAATSDSLHSELSDNIIISVRRWTFDKLLKKMWKSDNIRIFVLKNSLDSLRHFQKVSLTLCSVKLLVNDPIDKFLCYLITFQR